LCADFRQQDAENLLFKDSTFDVAVSRNLIWTLPDPEKALKEWRRVLKPSGSHIASDGMWMNTTWKRVHHLAFKALKGMFRNGSMISLRFLCWILQGLAISFAFSCSAATHRNPR
jgi:ubiquinone/menaquinone biosynthesis C-methylase UbiE